MVAVIIMYIIVLYYNYVTPPDVIYCLKKLLLLFSRSAERSEFLIESEVPSLSPVSRRTRAQADANLGHLFGWVHGT